jgi:hypothetical protein
MVGAFVVSFGGAFLGSFWLVRYHRPPRPRPPSWQFAVGVVAVIVLISLMAALDLGSSDGTAAAAGGGFGVLAGQWFGALREQSPG